MKFWRNFIKLTIGVLTFKIKIFTINYLIIFHYCIILLLSTLEVIILQV
jgi:hypothetical protein